MDNRNRKRIGYLFLLPTMAIILIFIVYPVISTLWNSFFEMRVQTLQNGKTFVGIEQYKKLLKDPQMWQALRFTLKFTIVAIVLETILGIACALIMNRNFKGKGFIRAAILVPWAVPTIVSGLMWNYMYSETYGIINYLLEKMHLISEPIHWLTDSTFAFWGIIIAEVWKTAPYMALLLLAGLQNIPKHLYEAAEIDGAGIVRRFFRITLPLLKPTLMVALLFRTIASFRIYDLVSVLTGGAPANTTQSLTMYTIDHYFKYSNIGYGSAAAMLTFAVSMILAMFFVQGMQSKLGVRTEK